MTDQTQIVEYKAFVTGDPDRFTTFSAKEAKDHVESYDLPNHTEYEAGVAALYLLSTEQDYFVGADAMESIGGYGWEDTPSSIAVHGFNEAGETVSSHEFFPFEFDRSELEHPETHFPTFYLGSKELTDEELEMRDEAPPDKSKTKYSFER